MTASLRQAGEQPIAMTTNTCGSLQRPKCPVPQDVLLPRRCTQTLTILTTSTLVLHAGQRGHRNRSTSVHTCLRQAYLIRRGCTAYRGARKTNNLDPGLRRLSQLQSARRSLSSAMIAPSQPLRAVPSFPYHSRVAVPNIRPAASRPLGCFHLSPPSPCITCSYSSSRRPSAAQLDALFLDEKK